MSNGWLLLQDRKGEHVYGKTGKVTGGGAALLMYPKENLIVAYTCNLTASMSITPIFSIAEHFLPAQEEEKK